MTDSKNLRFQAQPVCPHCGYKHTDPNEWGFGPGLDGDVEHDCDSCGEPFYCERVVTVEFHTANIKDQTK
tara:strand:+ start:89 stop:298 length:210 start_codon:yes stop_codon:yes gene_type:complete